MQRQPRRFKVPRQSPAERFARFVNQQGPIPERYPALGPCHLWTGGKSNGGYGRFAWNGRTGYAHRFSWEERHGPIPPGLHPLHRCDNPPCTNDGHLFLGTVADNNRDRHEKARDATGTRNGAHLHPERLARGEAHHAAKLTAGIVADVRERFLGGASIAALARKHLVSEPTIKAVVYGETWQHV